MFAEGQTVLCITAPIWLEKHGLRTGDLYRVSANHGGNCISLEGIDGKLIAAHHFRALGDKAIEFARDILKKQIIIWESERDASEG